MVRTYKIYANITATGSALAQVDIRRNGRILGVQAAITPTGTPTNNDALQCEISLYPSVQTTVNDGMGILAAFGAAGAILTSGAIPVTNAYKPCFGVEVKVGDRLYLHATEAGTQQWGSQFIVDVEENA